MVKIVKGAATFAVLLAVWQLVAASGVFPASLFPSPLSVAAALAERAASGQLVLDVGASMYRFLIGYVVACASAVLLGLLFGWCTRAWEFLNPLVQFIRPISPVAWLPFIVLWLGIGDIPAIVVIFLAAFFPVLLSTVGAVRGIDPVYLKVSRNFGLTSPATLFKVVLPASFPIIANALHIALGTAWIFLVAGEMAGTQSGLGFLIVDARNNLRSDDLLAAIVVIGVLGVVLDWVIRRFEFDVNRIWGTGIQEGAEA